VAPRAVMSVTSDGDASHVCKSGLVPEQASTIQKLVAARVAADLMDVPTV